MPISITNFFLNEKKMSILYSITLSVLNFKFCSKSSTNELVSSGRPFVFVSPASLPNCPNLYKLKAASRASTPTKETFFCKKDDLDENPEEIHVRHRFHMIIY